MLQLQQEGNSFALTFMWAQATFAALRLPSIPQDANDPSAALARLVAFIRSERNAALQPIKFLLQGDAAAQDPAFLALMVRHLNRRRLLLTLRPNTMLHP